MHTSEEPPEPAAVPWAPLAQFRTRALGEISFASAAEFLSAAEPAPHEQATVPVARFGSAL